MQTQQFDPLITLITVTAAVLVVAYIASQIGRPDRDPQRMFTVDQRLQCFTRAGHRCEMSAFGLIRCQRPASHADHHYPYSKGGATSMVNAVAACARHNMSKGARVPTAMQTWLIRVRRIGYFPPGTPRRPGQWYGR